MAWCVAGRRDGPDAGHDLRFMVDELDLALNRREVVACGRYEEFFDVFVSLQLRQVGFGGPEIPLVLRYDEAGVGES